MRGDPTDGIYGVIAGEIRITTDSDDGQQQFLNIMQPGDVFGEISLADGGPRSANAVAAHETHIFVIERRPFLDALPQEPELTERLLTLLSSLVRHTSAMLEDSVFRNVPERLARFLVGRAAASKQHIVRISQSELALFLGASRQAVNQHLQEWQKAGTVSLSRGQITIEKPDQLRLLTGPA
jgi:CRP-like cAMP-binding protein